MKIRALLLTAMALASTASASRAEERTLTLSPDDTEISFSLEATGEDVLGHLQLARGEIRFDADTGTASGTVAIDALGAETGNRRRDEKMHEKVLESDRYPLIEFTPKSIEGPVALDGASDPVLHGSVWILGKEHPLDLPAHVEADGETLTFHAEFEVPFVAWGMHDPSLFVLRVAKVVNVSIDAEGKLAGGGLDAVSAGGR